MNLQNDLTQTAVGKLLDEREQSEREIASGILDFYLSRYSEVYVLICNNCKEKLALEIKDPARHNQHHHFGRQVIELSPKYLAHRARLDGSQGYQCGCGNDNRWAYVEWEAVRHGGAVIQEHDIHAIKAHIAATNYVPDVKIKGKDMIIEGKFTLRKLK